MSADALIKAMVCERSMQRLSTGQLQFWNTGHPLELRGLPPATMGQDSPSAHRYQLSCEGVYLPMLVVAFLANEASAAMSW